MPLVGEGAPGLGQEHPVVDGHAELAPPGRHDLTGDADPVSEREPGEPLEFRCPGGGAEELDATGGVLQGGEGELALHPAQHQPASDRHHLARLGARRQVTVGGHDRRGGGGRLVAVRLAGAAHPTVVDGTGVGDGAVLLGHGAFRS